MSPFTSKFLTESTEWCYTLTPIDLIGKTLVKQLQVSTVLHSLLHIRHEDPVTKCPLLC